MRIYFLALVGAAVALSGCTHSSSSPASITSIPGVSVAKPAAGGPGGNGSGFGAADGKKGDPCNDKITSDYNTVMALCTNASAQDMTSCTSAMQAFGVSHPNIDCTITTNG